MTPLLKKYSVLLGLAILVLIIDGSLNYDILGAGPGTLKFWLWVLFIFVLGLFIWIADEHKPPRDKDRPSE